MNKSASKSGSGSHGSSSQSTGNYNEIQKANPGNGISSIQLLGLFEEELKDIYWAEKALTKAIPDMIKNATAEELIETLENHLAQTEEHIKRVEQIFKILHKKASARICETMEDLILEAMEIMEQREEGAMCDAGIISAAQKIEHHEIASYGTLRQFAETLGLYDAVELLEITLDEEKAADEKLTEVAFFAIHVQEIGEETESETKSGR